jgi:hypothetical protein
VPDTGGRRVGRNVVGAPFFVSAGLMLIAALGLVLSPTLRRTGSPNGSTAMQESFGARGM